MFPSRQHRGLGGIVEENSGHVVSSPAACILSPIIYTSGNINWNSGNIPHGATPHLRNRHIPPSALPSSPSLRGGASSQRSKTVRVREVRVRDPRIYNLRNLKHKALQHKVPPKKSWSFPSKKPIHGVKNTHPYYRNPLNINPISSNIQPPFSTGGTQSHWNRVCAQRSFPNALNARPKEIKKRRKSNAPNSRRLNYYEYYNIDIVRGGRRWDLLIFLFSFFSPTFKRSSTLVFYIISPHTHHCVKNNEVNCWGGIEKRSMFKYRPASSHTLIFITLARASRISNTGEINSNVFDWEFKADSSKGNFGKRKNIRLKNSSW